MERRDSNPAWVAKLNKITRPSYVLVEGASPTTGYRYGFGFVFEHPNGPFIRINTEPRRTFLTEGTEKQAQESLVDLSQKTRAKSGGFFDIHPFYGAVWGTKLSPVAPNFLTDLSGEDETLMMIIYLTNMGRGFSGKLTREALAIGTTVTFPSSRANKLLIYMAKLKINPNQANRDQAIMNNLGDEWQKEFSKYHQAGTSRSMVLSPKNILGLMSSLENEDVITDLRVSRTYPQ